MDLALEPGVVLGERYRLVEPIAHGGMGSVWRAEHIALNLPVAVKVIDPRVARLELGVPRFLREARALAGLRSPHIVQVSDYGSQDGSQGSLVFLVMELLHGTTLGQRLKAERKLSTQETLKILEGVCRAMSHAHERGIVHRDLKPDNIFLCDASRDHVTKVIDFGIAKPMWLDATSNTETGSGTFLGTPSYMSPEQCRARTLDQRSDLWSIGVIAYECLVGRRLFNSLVVGEIVIAICTGELPLGTSLESLPPAFERWLTKALARDPEQRFQTASELFEGLRAALEGTNDPSAVHAAPTLSVPSPALPQPEPAAGSGTMLTGAMARSAPGPSSSRRWSRTVAWVLGALVAAAALFLLWRSSERAQVAAPAVDAASVAAAGGAASGGIITDTLSASVAAARSEAAATRAEAQPSDAGKSQQTPMVRDRTTPPPAPVRTAPAKPSRPAPTPVRPELDGLRQQR